MDERENGRCTSSKARCLQNTHRVHQYAGVSHAGDAVAVGVAAEVQTHGVGHSFLKANGLGQDQISGEQAESQNATETKITCKQNK